VNRRDFAAALAGAGVAARLGPAAGSAGDSVAEAPVSAAARALYRRSLVLDCNCGPPEADHLPLPPAALERVRASGVDVVKYSVGGINSDFAHTIAEIAYVEQLCEVHADYFTQVRTGADLERAKRVGKFGIILSFESVDMLGGRLENVALFRNLGVRVMQLSYNRKSPFAAGVLEPEAGGLTALGRDAVREMNRLGIALDLSHANAPTTTEALELSAAPPIMTHAGCAAVHAHPRNKSDAQLRALAARGGVVGIFDLPYLSASPHQPTVADYMAHLEHALQIAGADHVGVGSDVGIEPFDTSAAGMAEFARETAARQASGLAAPEEDRPVYVVGLNTPRRIEVIANELLRRAHPESTVEKVIGANFARVLGQIWGA
jgi:membrane dipeptidase